MGPTSTDLEPRVLRFSDVLSKTGLSRSSVYLRIRAGDFPVPVLLGDGRAVGFLQREVDGWINALADRRANIAGTKFKALEATDGQALE
jgi:prophage regulatory protein